MANQIIVYAVSLGPGSRELLTPAAEAVLRSCTAVAGYRTYLSFFPELFQGKRIISSGMCQEIDRCTAALDAALQGEKTAVVSSGDAGIYGMAGLLMELTETPKYRDIEIQVIPGVTAAVAGAALVGAPLMNDFCVISLSDLLTPREIILRRLTAAAEGDFVTALYNPGSTKRKELIHRAAEIFQSCSGMDLPAAVIHDIARKEELVRFCTLSTFPFDEMNMTSLVIIGNSASVLKNGKFYCRRGYRISE